MIYLKSTDNFVNFPRTNQTEFREYTLKFVNQTTQTTTVAKHLQNTSNNSSYYILSVLDIVNQLVNGQYDYYILDPDTNAVIESGVCQFGEYQIQNTMAYNNTVKINSYNPYFPPTPKPKKVLDVSLNGEYDVEEYDLVDVDVFVPETEVVSKTYDDNGKYMIKPSSSDKVMSEVDVTVNVPKRKEEQVKSITIQSSGDYTVTPDEGKVLSEVDINVPTFKETYDFNEIGYTNDLIDFNSELAVSKQILEFWERTKSEGVGNYTLMSELDTAGLTNTAFFPNIDLSGNTHYYLNGLFDVRNTPNIRYNVIPIDTYQTYDFQYQYASQSKLERMPKELKFTTTSTTVNMNHFFDGCSSLTSAPTFVFLNGGKIGSMSYFLRGCTKIACSDLNLDYSGVTDMSYAFSNTKPFTSLTLDLPNATNIDYLFSNMQKIPEQDYEMIININATTNLTSAKKILSEMNYSGIPSNSVLNLTLRGFTNANTEYLCYDAYAFTKAKITTDSKNLFGCLMFASKLTEVELNAPNVVNMQWFTQSASNCNSISDNDYSNARYVGYPWFNSTMRNIGGLTNLGKAFIQGSDVADFHNQSGLTAQSYTNIANTIYDMNLKGFSPTIKFNGINYNNNCSQEAKDLFITKNWTVALT